MAATGAYLSSFVSSPALLRRSEGSSQNQNQRGGPPSMSVLVRSFTSSKNLINPWRPLSNSTSSMNRGEELWSLAFARYLSCLLPFSTKLTDLDKGKAKAVAVARGRLLLRNGQCASGEETNICFVRSHICHFEGASFQMSQIEIAAEDRLSGFLLWSAALAWRSRPASSSTWWFPTR
ncbi:hypothetical protein NL676_039431 [Syzygium grande]|nr:hypothetical protein NL676_039431 [Syzygium grande]